MKDVNQSFFTGRLTRDPELRRTPTGKAVTNASIAVNDEYTKDGERHNKVIYVELVLWNGQGEALCKLAAKGNFIHVQGQYAPESWEEKETGVKRLSPKFNVSSWQLLEKSKVEKLDSSNKDDSSTVEEVPKPKRGRVKKEEVVPTVEDSEDEQDIPF